MNSECRLPSFPELLQSISREPPFEYQYTSHAAGQSIDIGLRQFQETPAETPAAVVAQPPMGGRYSQTPCHSNGQPHVEWLRPSRSAETKGGTQKRSRPPKKQKHPTKTSITWYDRHNLNKQRYNGNRRGY
ncbi:hypothetical protein MVEN_01138900 [Mycena venus]|uniref:Uncharacterized protein n=1 Tax=Mycena venus TaxID=2733690 RepID=A0A8H6Y992_9AGAR|nr:hypothetical protein MVEN_01138900 [Mycena venus]